MPVEAEQTDLYSAEEKATDTVNCPYCGGSLVYSPDDLALKCEYCGGKVEVDWSKRSEELNFYDLISSDKNTWASDANVFACNNCGAKTVLSKKEIAKKCPFCGTTNVVETDELCGLKPNAVLPFLLSPEDACQSAVKWAKKKLYAPRKFKKGVYPSDIIGNYTPAFTFDTHTVTSYVGKLGVTRVRTVHINGKTVTQTYTEWFHISGTYKLFFDDFLVQASEGVSQRDINAIGPFETNYSNEYSPEFLRGYSAAHYSKSGEACWNYAKGVMQKRIRSEILSQYHYDVIGSLSLDVTYNDIKYKYVLLPVYVGHYSYSKKLYNFFVNGRSGKVAGKTPVSPVKVLVTVFSGLLAIGGIVLFLYLKSRGG